MARNIFLLHQDRKKDEECASEVTMKRDPDLLNRKAAASGLVYRA